MKISKDKKTNLPLYKVEYTVIREITEEIIAKNKEEAIEKIKKFMRANLGKNTKFKIKSAKKII